MLVETKAKNIKPNDAPISDGTVIGLRLIPSNIKGHGKWKLRFTSPVTIKRRDMGLGSYPSVSIVQARDRGTKARILISSGIDPIDEKARNKLNVISKNKPLTFQIAALKVHETLKPGWKNAKHSQQWINTLTTYVFPKIGLIPVADLKVAHFANILSPIWLSKSETAIRVKQRCHSVMKWCFAQEFVQGNPLDIVDELLPKQKGLAARVQHFPSMPWRDIPNFLEKNIIDDTNVTKLLLEFIIHTVARSGEARNMIWNEIDLENKIWIIPANRMKANVTHRIPLSKRSIEILNNQKKSKGTDLVFHSLKNNKPLSDMTLTNFLKSRKTKSDVIGRHATMHGFRSSFRDWASENGYSRDLAERSLAHSIKNQTEAAYHRTDLIEQRRPMMEAWSGYICKKLQKN